MSLATGASAERARALQRLIEVMLAELRGGVPLEVSLDANLEADLAIDSLARAELLARIESAFGVRLPEEIALGAATPRALLDAIARAESQSADVTAAPAVEPLALPSEAGAPDGAVTLDEVLAWHVDRHAERLHVRLLQEEDRTDTMSYAALREEANWIAGAIQAKGLTPGDRVALMLPTSRAFFIAFFGVLEAGGVPVPIYPPFRLAQIEEHLRRQMRILQNCNASMLICDAGTVKAARLLRGGMLGMRHVATVDALLDRGGAGQHVRHRAEDLALIQYTSGSTGQPKGVMLTHANLLANIRAMGRVIQATPDDVFVSWLPLYHDMGLIGAWLGTLYHGVPLVIMPPQRFLAHPAHWLRTLHRYRGTLSAGPNFAYEIVASKLRDRDLAGLDLGAWRIAFNGAEPVRAATLERFAQRLAPFNFSAKALYPVYGLAECGVGLTFPPLQREPRIDHIDRASLARIQQAVVTAAGPQALDVVSCGVPLPGHEVRVVDGSNRELPERSEGRIQFRGPSATAGYYANPQATEALVQGAWLETGDVGYIAAGELYLTSRAKDLIVRAGHNIHPYDLEEAISRLEGVRPGSIAVFGANDPAAATERLVVLVETRAIDATQRAALRSRIAELAISHLGIPVDDIVLTSARVVRKTSSGKIRRAACRELYESGVLAAPDRPVWWQVARLQTAAAWGNVRRLLHAAVVEPLYAMYVWTLFVALSLIGVVLCFVLPTLSLRRRAAKCIARLCIWLSMIRVRTDGLHHLVRDGPAVYVANHASYIDAIVLVAYLPADVTFTAKRAFRNHPFMRVVFGRLGVRYVVRLEKEQGLDNVEALAYLAEQGEALVLFPEGGFSRRPGLASFHMGAFVVAATAKVPLVPVVLRGTRSMLRADSWYPRRHAVALIVQPAIRSDGQDWQAALRLRNAARASMLRVTGEPDLGA